MASTPLLKVFILAAVLGLAGCVKLPNFPTFFSHQDLRDQEREIDNSFRKRID
mgnify:CR=1 FL=1